MCEPEDSAGRRVVSATALEANEARLDNVDSANTVSSGKLVESLEELKRAGDGLTALDLELDGDTGAEGDAELGRGVGGVERVLMAVS